MFRERTYPLTECAAQGSQRAARPQWSGGVTSTHSLRTCSSGHPRLPRPRPALPDRPHHRGVPPLFERHLPDLMSPEVFAHDHGDWEDDYRREVPTFHDPARDRFVTLAEEQGRILGYVGWNITEGASARLEMVAVDPPPSVAASVPHCAAMLLTVCVSGALRSCTSGRVATHSTPRPADSMSHSASEDGPSWTTPRRSSP